MANLPAQSAPRLPACIILTATVQVDPQMAFTVRRDAGMRYQDYKQAFQQWLQLPDNHPILLVENSGFDLAELKLMAASHPGKRVEFLSFTAPPFDGSLGKGYGEMLCLEYCLAHSELLRTTRRFLKITGRYYLANATAILEAVDGLESSDVVCDLLDNLRWADSRVFGGDVSFLRDTFCPMRSLLNDSQGSAFENVLARAAHRCMAEGGRWALMPVVPQIKGHSGSLGHRWSRTPLMQFKLWLRIVLLARLLRRYPE